ncbi:hypothetical protein BH11CYA1_BH11CYA1_23390 [soil metagenome]
MQIITTLTGRVKVSDQSTELKARSPEQHFLQAMATSAVQQLFKLCEGKGLAIVAVSYDSRLLVAHSQLREATKFGCISSPATFSSEYLVEENFAIEGDITKEDIAFVGMAVGMQRSFHLPFLKVNFRPTFHVM